MSRHDTTSNIERRNVQHGSSADQTVLNIVSFRHMNVYIFKMARATALMATNKHNQAH